MIFLVRMATNNFYDNNNMFLDLPSYVEHYVLHPNNDKDYSYTSPIKHSLDIVVIALIL